MPIIKSAKKRVKQTAIRKARNYNTRTAVKKAIRIINDAVKAGDKAAAEAALPSAYKIIDTAAKKGVLNIKTAARRKSTLATLAANADKKKVVKVETKAEKKATAKKEAAKVKAEAVTEVVTEETSEKVAEEVTAE